MTTPITYPPGEISLWGINEALLNQSSSITYIGVDGSIFYLTGPQSPIAGAQDGLVLNKHMGLMAPFEMLEQRGARQDGATWQDAVYDVGEIMFSLEASGIAPQNIRNVLRQWISAWDPKQTGILSVVTPDMGEWWANVRMGKNLSDQFDRDYTWSGKQPLTWSIKNYDAFWQSVDSTSSFGFTYNSQSLNMGSLANAASLTTDEPTWTQIYSSGTGGTYGILNGSAQWVSPAGTTGTDVINIAPGTSTTDNQVSTIQYAGANLANLFQARIPGGKNDIWVRLNAAGTAGVRLRLDLELFTLSYMVGSTITDFFKLPLIIPPKWNDVFTLLAGTDADPYEFKIQRNGNTIFRYTDSAHHSQMGSTYRNWGFGAGTGIFGIGGTHVTPPPIRGWSAGDNIAATQSGWLPLTNIGDLDVWPRYLCYGPGTFSFGNGPGNTDLITFGPLLEDQVVLVTTDPQYRSIVDLSPSQPAPTLTQFATLLQKLISFATNNNAPPLLQQFESKFGILPPQGNLYSLLNGRFTNPLPGTPYGVAPTQESLLVEIVDGGPTSQVIAAVTPLRRWPL